VINNAFLSNDISVSQFRLSSAGKWFILYCWCVAGADDAAGVCGTEYV